jgi:DNA topoisomerase-3
VKAGKTRPPRPHDDASILQAMETAGRDLDDAALKRAMRQSGLGTPATRANILTTLVKRGFVVRQQRALRSTDRGRALVEAVPVDELTSAQLTGRWEARLSAIAEGRDDRSDFMAAVRQRATEVVRAILAADPPDLASEPDDRVVLGECPVCGTPVREGRGAYSCEKGRDCSFVIFKKIAKREISKRSAVQLLTKGRTGVLKRFKSKKGKVFEAALVLGADGRVEMDFSQRHARRVAPSPRGRAPAVRRTQVGDVCPGCGQGRVIRGRVALGCSRWQQGCSWRTGGFGDAG